MSISRSGSLLFVGLAALAGLGGGCGDDGGGPKSMPLIGNGTGSGTEVGSGRLTVSLPIDPVDPLTMFSAQAKTLFGKMVDQSGFGVTYAKVTLDISNSKGVLHYTDAWSGNIDVRLRPGGTNPPVVLGSFKAPAGAGEASVPLSVTRKNLDAIKQDILDGSITPDVSGPTMWNSGVTPDMKKVALKIEFQLQAIGP